MKGGFKFEVQQLMMTWCSASPPRIILHAAIYRFATREQAMQVVFEHIEVFYNRIRRHAKIGNQAPADFANQQQFAA